jgi:hypothetical protein
LSCLDIIGQRLRASPVAFPRHVPKASGDAKQITKPSRGHKWFSFIRACFISRLVGNGEAPPLSCFDMASQGFRASLVASLKHVPKSSGDAKQITEPSRGLQWLGSIQACSMSVRHSNTSLMYRDPKGRRTLSHMQMNSRATC